MRHLRHPYHTEKPRQPQGFGVFHYLCFDGRRKPEPARPTVLRCTQSKPARQVGNGSCNDELKIRGCKSPRSRTEPACTAQNSRFRCRNRTTKLVHSIQQHAKLTCANCTLSREEGLLPKLSAAEPVFGSADSFARRYERQQRRSTGSAFGKHSADPASVNTDVPDHCHDRAP